MMKDPARLRNATGLPRGMAPRPVAMMAGGCQRGGVCLGRIGVKEHTDKEGRGNRAA